MAAKITQTVLISRLKFITYKLAHNLLCWGKISTVLPACCVWLFVTVLSFSACAQQVVLNKGIGGNSSGDLLRRIDKDVLAENPDLVIIMVGTNDMVNSKKMVSYEKYRANYQTMIQKLKAKKINIVLMSCPPVDTGYLFTRHDRNLYKFDPNSALDSAGKIVNQLSKENSLYFIDLNGLFKSMGSPGRDANSLIINQANFGKEDGIHPTKAGYEVIAAKIYTYLKENKLLKKGNRIICFGDSITYGSFMPGAGTSEGDTYPAVLKKLINKSASGI